jgi:hypothetical protein
MQQERLHHSAEIPLNLSINFSDKPFSGIWLNGVNVFYRERYPPVSRNLSEDALGFNLRITFASICFEFQISFAALNTCSAKTVFFKNIITPS